MFSHPSHKETSFCNIWRPFLRPSLNAENKTLKNNPSYKEFLQTAPRASARWNDAHSGISTNDSSVLDQLLPQPALTQLS